MIVCQLLLSLFIFLLFVVRIQFGFVQAIIVHRSLCILHAVLNHLPGLEWKSEKRYGIYLSFVTLIFVCLCVFFSFWFQFVS